jgi:hypothetical protein
MVAMRANVPFAPTVKDAGAMTPAGIAVRIPVAPGRAGGKIPVTATTVPGRPAVGARVRGRATVKVAFAVRAPTVAVKVATPKGAAASMVTVVVNAPAAVVVMVGGGIGAMTPGGTAARLTGIPSAKPLPVTVTTVPEIPLVGKRTITRGGTVKVALAMTPVTLAVKVCTLEGAAASMVTMVVNAPPGVVVMGCGSAMTPAGAVRFPTTPGGKPTPVTVTTVPGIPLVGERVIAGAGSTVKVSVAVTAPTVAVKVCTPKGAAGSTVNVTAAGIIPAGVVMKLIGGPMTAAGPVRVPAVPPGKPVPFTVTMLPGEPKSGARVSTAVGSAAAGEAITPVRLATRARTVSRLSILCFVVIYVSPFFKF